MSHRSRVERSNELEWYSGCTLTIKENRRIQSQWMDESSKIKRQRVLHKIKNQLNCFNNAVLLVRWLVWEPLPPCTTFLPTDFRSISKCRSKKCHRHFTIFILPLSLLLLFMFPLFAGLPPVTRKKIQIVCASQKSCQNEIKVKSIIPKVSPNPSPVSSFLKRHHFCPAHSHRSFCYRMITGSAPSCHKKTIFWRCASCSNDTSLQRI